MFMYSNLSSAKVRRILKLENQQLIMPCVYILHNFAKYMTQLLFINNVGGLEVIVILLFVLMFFGAKSIPGLAKTLGRGMREIQHASDEIKREIRSTGDNIKKDLQLGDQVNQVIQDIERQPRQLLDQIEDTVDNTRRDLEQQINKLDQPEQSKSDNV